MSHDFSLQPAVTFSFVIGWEILTMAFFICVL
jgi:hypothetical protein